MAPIKSALRPYQILRQKNHEFEYDVRFLKGTTALSLLRTTLRGIKNEVSDAATIYQQADPFRKIFSVNSDDTKSDGQNLEYHLSSIKPGGSTSIAAAYLAWMCFYHGEPAGPAESFYRDSGLQNIISPYRRFNGNPLDAYRIEADLKSGQQGFNIIDWEIAYQRVKAEMVDRNGYLSFAKLRIDDMPIATRDIPSLRRLNLSASKIRTILSGSYLNNLEVFDCSYTEIVDLTPIRDCRSLSRLYCGVSKISDLAALTDMTNLTSLFCGSTPVHDLGPLQGNQNLRQLHIENTHVTSLDALSSCHSLEIIGLQDTKVHSLRPLSNCRNLRRIYLNGCEIKEVNEGFWEMPSLKEVVFYRGQLTSVDRKFLSKQSDENCLNELRGRISAR